LGGSKGYRPVQEDSEDLALFRRILRIPPFSGESKVPPCSGVIQRSQFNPVNENLEDPVGIQDQRSRPVQDDP
jgi:hypothetical protein